MRVAVARGAPGTARWGWLDDGEDAGVADVFVVMLIKAPRCSAS